MFLWQIIDAHASYQILQIQVDVKDTKWKITKKAPLLSELSFYSTFDITIYTGSITCNEDQFLQKMVQVMNTKSTFNSLYIAINVLTWYAFHVKKWQCWLECIGIHKLNVILCINLLLMDSSNIDLVMQLMNSVKLYSCFNWR